MRIIIESTERTEMGTSVYGATQPAYRETIEAGTAIEGQDGFGLVSFEGAVVVETEGPGGFGLVSFGGGAAEMGEGLGGFGGVHLGSAAPEEAGPEGSEGFGGASMT
jgi:hypothetical protein